MRAQTPGPVKEEREKEGGEMMQEEEEEDVEEERSSQGEMKVGGRVDTGGELGGVKKTGVRAGRVRMKEVEQKDGGGGEVDGGGGELSRTRRMDGSDAWKRKKERWRTRRRGNRASMPA